MEVIKIHLEVRERPRRAAVYRQYETAGAWRRKLHPMIMAGAAALLLLIVLFGFNNGTMAHQFTSGRVDIRLSNDGATYSNGVNRTWVSPQNWAPGDELTAQLFIRDSGRNRVGVLLADWTNPTYGDPNLLSVVEVTSWRESGDAFGVNRAPLYAAVHDGDGDGRLSIWELINAGPVELGHLPDGNSSYRGGGGSTCSIDESGGVYVVEMSFRFMEEAGNEYQGAEASFDLQINAAGKYGSDSNSRGDR
ncbi:MAG: hypothetical protein ACYC5A_05415 [Thermoleophilia bacterium]